MALEMIRGVGFAAYHRLVFHFHTYLLAMSAVVNPLKRMADYPTSSYSSSFTSSSTSCTTRGILRDRLVTTHTVEDLHIYRHSLLTDNTQDKTLLKSSSFFDYSHYSTLKNHPSHINSNVTDLYLSRLELSSSLIGGAKPKRSVPQTPERVLDAPGIVNDFYLNVLDWSARNVLAVALGPSVYLWNAADASVKELLSLPEADGDANVTSLSWIYDGTFLAVGTSDGSVQMWDVQKGRKLRTMLASQTRISTMAWNRHLLSTGSRDGAVLTHDVRIAKHLVTEHSKPTGHEVCGLTWSCDGRQLAGGSNNNLVHIWDVNASSPTHILEGHRGAVKALSWSPYQASVLASGGGAQDKTIKLWRDGECIESVDAASQVTALKWSRLSRELVSTHGFERNHISIWNYQDDVLEHAACIDNAHDSRILHLTMSPDARTIATAAADESIKFWPLFPSSSKKNDKKSEDSKNKTSKSISPFSLKTKSLR